MEPKNLKELIEQGYAFPALLPENNDYLIIKKDSGKTADEMLKKDTKGSVATLDLSRLEKLQGYTIPLVNHDYGAKTPLMWNSLYEKLGLNIRNIMLVANPEDTKIITSAFRQDPKYLGGGFGVGFKKKLEYLDHISPDYLSSVNIVVKEQGKLIGYNTDAPGFVKSLDDKFVEINKSIQGSNIILLGGGGTVEEISRLIADKGPKLITIINRTTSKAVEIAYRLNRDYGEIAEGLGEHHLRGSFLNSFKKPDAVVNLTDKGNDGRLIDYSALAKADLKSEEGKGNNETLSRAIARGWHFLNPNIIVADITLPSTGRSITLRIAEEAGLPNLLDGKPMVINQGAKAYELVQNAHPNLHKNKLTEEQALKEFKEVA